jgi:hypothetical protein
VNESCQTNAARVDVSNLSQRQTALFLSGLIELFPGFSVDAWMARFLTARDTRNIIVFLFLNTEKKSGGKSSVKALNEKINFLVQQ